MLIEKSQYSNVKVDSYNLHFILFSMSFDEVINFRDKFITIFFYS